jgi:EAL domain-containing protein (putative c-di-GMP-specific phosphodiesterase class I)
MDARMQARRQLEVGLRRALVQEEFELHQQPLVNLQDNSITGFEALLRWRDPEKGLVFPADFIPLAEETGLIVPIGDWVIRRACADTAAWPGSLRVAVNLSAVQFKGRDLITVVFGALAASYLPAGRLELEITESVLLKNNEFTLATLHQLRDLGVRISMDDFGTGYSSLSYLRSFPFDNIKIDQSFIHDLIGSDDSLAIVRAVTSLGAALGMTITAEGVETSEQLECLRNEGCTEVQGIFVQPASSLGAACGILLRPQMVGLCRRLTRYGPISSPRYLTISRSPRSPWSKAAMVGDSSPTPWGSAGR